MIILTKKIKQMQELQKSQHSQGSDFLLQMIQVALTVAYDRLEVELPIDRLKKISQDVLKEFGSLNPEIIVSAIRNGSLGKYGRTYKLNVQEVCLWIREHLKSDEVYAGLSISQKKMFPKPKIKEDRL